MIFAQELIHVIRPAKQNKLRFSSSGINMPLAAPVYNVSWLRFTFRPTLVVATNQMLTLRVESSIISIDSNITDNISVGSRV